MSKARGNLQRAVDHASTLHRHVSQLQIGQQLGSPRYLRIRARKLAGVAKNLGFMRIAAELRAGGW